jgi:hypothetical protein
MSDRYPFDANGNLLPGLSVVGGQIIAVSGQVVPGATVPVETVAVEAVAPVIVEPAVVADPPVEPPASAESETPSDTSH